MIIDELFTKLGFKVDETGISKGEDRLKKFKGFIGKLALGAGILAIGKYAIQSAAQMETMNAQFTTMLGSAEKAKKLMDEILTFSAATPFQQVEVAKATQTLLQFGVSADKVMSSVSMIGDIAGANKERFAALSLAYGQTTAAGRLMGQDLLQMINAGFNPLKVISEQTGKSMAELKKQMEKGGISAKAVELAYRSATSEGGMFYKNMQRQSQTMVGLWSTMMDNFQIKLVGAMQPLLPLIKELIRRIGQIDITFLVKSFEWLADVIPQIGKKIWDSGLSEAFATTSTAVKEMIGQFLKLIGATGKGVKGAISTITGLLKTMASSILFVVTMISRFAQSIFFIMDTLSPLAPLLKLIIAYNVALWGAGMISGVLAYSRALKTATIAMGLFGDVTLASVAVSAKLALSNIYTAWTLGGLKFAALEAGMALKTMALTPVNPLMALAAVLASIYYFWQKVNEEEAKGTKEREQAAWTREQSRLQADLGNRRKALAEDKALLKTMNEQGWSDKDKKAVQDRINLAEQQLPRLQKAFGEFSGQVQQQIKSGAGGVPDFNAMVNTQTGAVQAQLQKTAKSDGKTFNINNELKMEINSAPGAKTGLSAKDVAEIASTAVQSQFNIQLRSALLGNLS